MREGRAYLAFLIALGSVSKNPSVSTTSLPFAAFAISFQKNICTCSVENLDRFTSRSPCPLFRKPSVFSYSSFSLTMLGHVRVNHLYLLYSLRESTTLHIIVPFERYIPIGNCRIDEYIMIYTMLGLDFVVEVIL